MLQITNLRKSYQSQLVLDIPELCLETGIYWLKGINGSGKTTFFKTLSGMLDFEGDIILDTAFHINKNPEAYRLRVNYSEAEPLYPDFISGNDLLQFVAKAKKAPNEQVQTLTQQFEMQGYLKNAIGTYSSGMLKKVALVLAFLGKPSWILLDEPLITIDKAATQTLLKFIQEAHQAGVSFLLSSHQDFPPDSLPIKQVFELSKKTLLTS